MISLQDVFAPQGLLAKTFPQHEHRDGQLKMAETIHGSLEQKRHTAIQAGTGLGKTFSYLIPAILSAVENKTRIVVSTGTINLQAQIVKKDIPALKQVFAGVCDFDAVLVKGRGNYLCRRKVEGLQGTQLQLLPSVGDDQWQRFLDWYEAGGAKQGDMDELPFRPHGEMWAEVNSEQDLCLRKECRFYPNECYFYCARSKQKEAQILITNHALFFADLAVRRAQGFQSEPAVLESYDAVIFDEAQSVEDVATEFYSAEVSLPRIRHLLHSIRAALRPGGSLQWTDEPSYERFEALGQNLIEKAERFFYDLTDQFEGTVRLREPGLVDDTFSPELTYLGEQLKALAVAAQTEEQRTTITALGARAHGLGSDLQSICQLAGGEKYAYWLEINADQPDRSRLASAPISLAADLKESLFDRVPVAMTSATLSSELLKRIGFVSAEMLRLESPFDYPNQALLYVATDGPEPKESEAFDEFTAQRVLELVQLSRGRAFVLFTSYRAMKAAYDQAVPLLQAWGYTPMMQGEMRRDELLKAFKEHGHATLFAVASFWEGVDVVGDALSLVILVKLPFAVPTEPIIQARMEALEKDGQDPFNAYTLPHAVLRLKQGFGRLIRSKTDRGVIAILDKRVLTKAYGRTFLRALPPARPTRMLTDVKRFFMQ